jgi:uncharacterized protein (TIGR03435 family)
MSSDAISMTRKSPLIGKLLLMVAVSATVPSLAQTADPPRETASPVFEVATVKLNKSGVSGSHSSLDNDRFTATNVSLKNVMQYQAYGIPEPRILDGPKWLNTERFDIQAKADSATLDALKPLRREDRQLQIQRMFQQLLADRFKLTVHWETRELPVYAMIVAKNGSHLQATKQTDDGASISTNNGELTARGVTMAEIARALTQELSRELGRVVVDKTGVDGRYDITLRWTPESGAAPVSYGAGDTASQPDAGPSIFTAFQEQLGLKLESTKGPVQVLVIDHVEMPSEN